MITIETPTTAAGMAEVIDVLGEVWRSATPMATVEMLVAIAHAGGYICLAVDDTTDDTTDGSNTERGNVRRPLGASIGLPARHSGGPALHSHVTGLVPSARGAGVGRAIKLHQRAWAAANGIERIVWTFDPLVRRNAWFNIAVLGAEVCEYLPSFYGAMTDEINAGDESDRLLVTWDVHRPLPVRPLDGAGAGTGAPRELIPTPVDVVALRRTDPSAVAVWRMDTRRALTSALAAGRAVIGFTTAGDYVIGSRT